MKDSIPHRDNDLKMQMNAHQTCKYKN